MMRRYALYFAWVISLAGLLLSLYYGELLQLEPCRLCWYQRIALFPLAILLGIAAFREDRHFIPYGIVLAVLGFVVGLYQWLKGIFPSLSSPAICGFVRDCSEVVFELFGVITFPALSAIGFAAIVILLLRARAEN